MNFESSNRKVIESGSKPEKLYRGFTVNPELLSLEMLQTELVPGSVRADDPTKIGDGNELGVYMSTNSRMVESAYVHKALSIVAPNYINRGGITNTITLPSCGILVEIDATKLAIRQPEISKPLQGHYNNGYEGDEWIADTVPKEAYRITKLVLSEHSNDIHKLVIDVRDFSDEQLTEVIDKIKAEFEIKKQEALRFKAFLESLTPQERVNEYSLKRKYEKYKLQGT